MCLGGFIMARLVVIWLTRAQGINSTRPEPEARHAP